MGVLYGISYGKVLCGEVYVSLLGEFYPTPTIVGYYIRF